MTQKNPTVTEYYATKESKWGYKLFLSDTRHFGYYPKPTINPFPLRTSLQRMEEKLFQKLMLAPGSRVLDAGCGAGNVASYMAQQGLSIEAIDVVDRHIAIATESIKSRNLSSKITVSKMNYQELTFENEYFDGIYTIETLVHADDPVKALSEFYRTLKPGGRLVLFEYSRAKDSDINRSA